MDNFGTKNEIYSEGKKETKWKTIFIEKEK
jgi:hypothetical protein